MSHNKNLKLSSIGTAKTVLVINLDGEPKAVVSSITIELSTKNIKERVEFLGPVSLDPESVHNIKSNVLGIVDKILGKLGQNEKFFRVSLSNLAAASAHDIPIEIEGFSAELSIFIAMISAALQVPITQDVVTTGHIASLNGEIGMVSGLPEKIIAASEDPGISKFICPSLDSDLSLKTLSPREHNRIEKAITEFSNAIKIIPVTDATDALKIIFDESEIALGSLQSGFFEINAPAGLSDGAIDQAVAFLLNKNYSRFWSGLEAALLSGEIDKAKKMLGLFVKFYISKKRYPADFGGKLAGLMMSLPPSIKRQSGLFPIITPKDYFNLAQYATDNDYSDAQMLMETSQGRHLPQTTTFSLQPVKNKERAPAETDSLLEHFLEELSAEYIAKKVLAPIDSARASYIMDKISVETHIEFNEAISSFYCHVLRYLDQINGKVIIKNLFPDALDLLTRAFNAKGGINAAYFEGINPVKGGLRYVFDVMTEQLKLEAKEKQIRTVFKETVDPLSNDQKVALMATFLKRIGPNLPEEVRFRTAEQYASNYEEIIVAYSQSLDKVIDILKIL